MLRGRQCPEYRSITELLPLCHRHARISISGPISAVSAYPPKYGVIGTPRSKGHLPHDTTTVGHGPPRHGGRGGLHSTAADHRHHGSKSGGSRQLRPGARQRSRPVACAVREPLAQATGEGRTPHQPGAPDDPGRTRTASSCTSLPRPTPTGPASESRPRRSGLRSRRSTRTGAPSRASCPLSAARKLAALPNTGTLVQALQAADPSGRCHQPGRGAAAHRQGAGEGRRRRGITIGALSDSYDDATLTATGERLKIHAKQDVASGDLPGKGNRRNPQPVQVLEDLEGDESAIDEGRAMLQIAHDVAPGASSASPPRSTA